MNTNASTSINAELHAAAQELIEAAHAYWKLYQRHIGKTAVVWIDDTSGHFVLFTRGEYKYGLLASANVIANDEAPMEHPFEQEVSE